jgi:hypothetical protein
VAGTLIGADAQSVASRILLSGDDPGTVGMLREPDSISARA